MSASPVPSALPSADRRRAAYLAELALGTDRFHEPPRADCPWCGSRQLRTRFTAPDLLQHKPGRFTLDECRDCAHAFQNPPLTPEGLAFHDRDRYEGGLGVPSRRRLRTTARVVLPYGEPESWLDVGTGRADFPAVARRFFPYTAFDGSDPTPRVLEARAAGRIEEAHVGHLATPGLAARLRARYDVVTVLHRLEHAPDPRAELDAALTALRPGGILLLEAADPDCAFAAILGKWWFPHTQPRHPNLLPLANVRAELESRGCTVLVAAHRPAHRPQDLSAALALALAHAVPDPDEPWRPAPPSEVRRTVRTVLDRVSAPLLALARAADLLLYPLLREGPFANSYRIVARKDAA
jgi:SAM-dependent methyltransferase